LPLKHISQAVRKYIDENYGGIISSAFADAATQLNGGIHIWFGTTWIEIIHDPTEDESNLSIFTSGLDGNIKGRLKYSDPEFYDKLDKIVKELNPLIGN